MQQLTTAAIAIALIAAFVVLQITRKSTDGLQEGMLIVIGFYFGGHVSTQGGTVVSNAVANGKQDQTVHVVAEGGTAASTPSSGPVGG